MSLHSDAASPDVEPNQYEAGPGIQQESDSVEQRIAAEIKSSLENLTEVAIERLMEEHLVRLGLLTQTQPRLWAHHQLVELAGVLLPGDLTRHQLDQLVDDMAENAARNPYLHEYLEKAGAEDTDQLVQRARQEGGAVFPDLVTYAAVLDRLNRALTRDWRLLEVCHQVWTSQHTKLQILKTVHFNIFKFVKAISIGSAIKGLIENFRSQNVPADWGLTCSINICEAIAEDLRLLNIDNALAAKPLVFNRPGLAENRHTMAASTQLSKDGQTLEMRPPLPRQWADLYVTWNLAFVSYFPNFPYYMVKLLIPSVSGYQDRPEGFLYPRATALYAHIQWLLSMEKQGGPRIDWASTALTRSWGRVNRTSAQDYNRQLKELVAEMDENVSSIFVCVCVFSLICILIQYLF